MLEFENFLDTSRNLLYFFVSRRISYKGVKILILWNLFLKKLDVLVGSCMDQTVMCLYSVIYIYISEYE